MWRKRQSPDREETPIKDKDAARSKTMERAGRLLAAKPRSVRELRDRLLEKSWTNAEIVDEVMQKIVEYKYLDDDQFARDAALSKLRQKPQGRRRLMQSMSQKKLDKDVVDTAVDAAFESMPEDELIDRAIAKRLRLKGKPETREDTKKFLDHLLRQGFGYDLIREKMAGIATGEFDDE